MLLVPLLLPLFLPVPCRVPGGGAFPSSPCLPCPAHRAAQDAATGKRYDVEVSHTWISWQTAGSNGLAATGRACVCVHAVQSTLLIVCLLSARGLRGRPSQVCACRGKSLQPARAQARSPPRTRARPLTQCTPCPSHRPAPSPHMPLPPCHARPGPTPAPHPPPGVDGRDGAPDALGAARDAALLAGGRLHPAVWLLAAGVAGAVHPHGGHHRVGAGHTRRVQGEGGCGERGVEAEGRWVAGCASCFLCMCLRGGGWGGGRGEPLVLPMGCWQGGWATGDGGIADGGQLARIGAARRG